MSLKNENCPTLAINFSLLCNSIINITAILQAIEPVPWEAHGDVQSPVWSTPPQHGGATPIPSFNQVKHGS